MTSTAPPPRILSIDIFRGLTMLVMIFVNDLAGVQGLPWWTYHMPRGVDGMTYVDVVFPAFLFIVGMSIPLSIEHRLSKEPSQIKLWRHILLRFAALAALGIFIANTSKLDARVAGFDARLWSLAGFGGAMLLWNSYRPGRAGVVLRLLGLTLFCSTLALFRRTLPNGQIAWLDFRYWEILGLIARTYLAVCILYVPLRKRPWAPLALLAALCALNLASRLGWTPWLRGLSFWVWPFGRGELASITMAGVAFTHLFLLPSTGLARRLRHAALLFAALAAGGALLRGFGLTKLGATPSWCLWCSAISLAIFTALYWLVDVRGFSAWAAFVRPAGANTLLTYLLPDIYYAAFGFASLPAVLNAGAPGVARSVVFTALMAAAAALLTRWRVRLQL